MNLEKKPLEWGILFLVAAGILAYFGLYPLAKSTGSVNLQVKTKSAELSKKQDQFEGLKQIKAQMPQIQGQLTAMTNALPKGEDLPDLMVSLEALGYSSGLEIATMSPGGTGQSATEAANSSKNSKQTASSGIGSVQSTMSLNGSYASIIAFLENVENDLRPTTVNSIKVTGSGSDSNLKADAQLASFYQE